jgi:NADPH-dependent curcumin reductase CurA
VQGSNVVGEIISMGSPDLVDMFGTKLQKGDLVNCYTGWQQYGVAIASKIRKLNAEFYENLPPSFGFGVLGMPGLTGNSIHTLFSPIAAYFGFLEAGKPQPGETVVVSGAAGAVGSVVVTITTRNIFNLNRFKSQKSKAAKS